MFEPEKQVEIQLGHMCNNRCVFCVSGQRTERREAFPVELAPILAEIRAARARGSRKITLLGGEPTLQPGFLDVIRACAREGFEEVVVFTNGAKTANAERIDEILAIGAPITWRISIQGATRASHERTTRKEGSFDRILRTLEHLAARRQPITVNLCVVSTNYEDLDRFAALLPRYGVRQLHIDLMRPLDAGERSEEELRALMPPFAALAASFERLARAMPPGFDLNFGNLPYCVAPALIPWIHHDGERTETIAVDERDRLSRPWDKYSVKRRDKFKPDRCRACAMDDRCSGVFEHHARFHGTRELVPLRLEPRRIPERRPWLHPAIERALARFRAADLGPCAITAITLEPSHVEIALDGGRARFWIAVGGKSGYSVEARPGAEIVAAIRALVAALRGDERDGMRP